MSTRFLRDILMGHPQFLCKHKRVLYNPLSNVHTTTNMYIEAFDIVQYVHLIVSSFDAFEAGIP